MKVVKIINSLDYGGIEKVFEIFAKYFDGERTDVIFVAIGGGGQAEQYIRSRGFEVIVLGRTTKIPNLRIIYQLVRLLRKIRPDVVHTCGAEGNFHGLIAAWLSKVPTRIAEEIGMPGHSSVAKSIFRLIYSRASAVIVVATSVAKYLIENKEVSAGKCKLIYNPVDVERFASIIPKRDPDKFVLLTVCRLHPIKNLERLLQVVAGLIKSGLNLNLELVGDGPSLRKLSELAVQLGVSDRVVFHGFQQDPSPFFSRANVFVLPSLSEGHPVSLIEAMVASVPAIVTSVGGAPEIIVDGESGWLIDPLDNSSIAAAIRKSIVIGEEGRQELIIKAKQIALARFSPANYFEQLYDLYENVNERQSN